MVARTVVDLRSSNGKFLCQTLLLAASWHKHAAGDAGLEVLTIGRTNPVFEDFLHELGARHVRVEPCANDFFSKHSNKIQGAGPDPAGRRVLLVDNDTCFIGDLAELNRIPPAAIAAAEAGHARVSDEQWQLIHEELGLPLLRRNWAPLNQRISANSMDTTVERDRWLYLNSGVVLFPGGLDHRSVWQVQQRAIHDYFHDHPLAAPAVTDDQAGFASSVATHGEFAWLPQRFN